MKCGIKHLKTWLKDYLTNRMECAAYNFIRSWKWLTVVYCKEYVIAPLLFLWYIKQCQSFVIHTICRWYQHVWRRIRNWEGVRHQMFNMHIDGQVDLKRHIEYTQKKLSKCIDILANGINACKSYSYYHYYHFYCYCYCHCHYHYHYHYCIITIIIISISINITITIISIIVIIIIIIIITIIIIIIIIISINLHNTFAYPFFIL